MKFLNPDQPLATCSSESCDGCSLPGRIHCHFRQRDLTSFLLSVAPSFLFGGIGIFRVSAWWLIPWIAIILGFFGLLEIRVLCSHCPHYAEKGKALQCWANYGSPRLWRYRPQPMVLWEKIVLIAGFSLIWGYPTVMMVISSQWWAFVAMMIATGVFFYLLQTHNCNQCINLSCPLNRVDRATRRAFLDRNPEMKKAFEDAGLA